MFVFGTVCPSIRISSPCDTESLLAHSVGGTGGAGAAGTNFDSTHGAGGGGGGAGGGGRRAVGGVGGEGGNYGAGGGGGGGSHENTGTGNIGGASKQGIIVITYTPVVTAVTTIADGTDPANSTVAPGSSITDLDAFVLSTNSGTDSVTALTVNLSSGSAASLSEVRITSSDGSTTYFSAVTNPGSDTINFTGGTAIPVTTTATTFKVRITPKTHANMPAPNGSIYTVTGTTTAFTSTNTQAGADTNSATITIDNASPSGATVTSGSASDQKVTLNWTTSASSDYSRSVVLRWAAATPGAEVPAEGTDYAVDDTITTATVACVETTGTASFAESGVDGAGTGGCSAVALTNGQQYSYKVFQKDSNGNYDTGVTFSGSPFTPTNTPPTASAVSIDSGVATVILTENTTRTVSCAGTVSDPDGFADITSVQADLFRTDRGIGSGLDDNDHYQLSGDASCVPSAGSGNSETYTCDFSVQYFADATDAGSPNSATNWTCTMTPTDTVTSGTADSDTIEMSSLTALSVSASIDYGNVDPNTDTGATNQTTIVTNTGNRDMDPQLSGTDMTDGGNSIAVGQQKYSATSFTYSSGGVALSGTPTTLNLALPQRTTTVVTDTIHWGLGVLNGTPAGTYTGINTVGAVGGI